MCSQINDFYLSVFVYLIMSMYFRGHCMTKALRITLLLERNNGGKFKE